MNRPFINRAVLNRMIERREREERMIVTLAKGVDYHELPEGWQDIIPRGWTPQGGSPAMPKEWV